MRKTGLVTHGRDGRDAVQPEHEFRDLIEMCTAAFCSPTYAVDVDVASSTVWVRRAEGRRSIGLKLGVLERYGASAMLARTKAALAIDGSQ